MKKFFTCIIIFLTNIYIYSNEFNNQIGITGNNGAIGQTGSTGELGADGVPGSDGQEGTQGPQGINLRNKSYLFAYHTNKQRNLQNSSFLNGIFANIRFDNISISNGIVTPNFSHFTPIESGTYQFSYIIHFVVQISTPITVAIRAAKGPYIKYLQPGMPIPNSENGKEIIFNGIKGTDQTISLQANTGIFDPSVFSTGFIVGDFTTDLMSNESIVIQATAYGTDRGGDVAVQAPTSIASLPSVNATLLIKKILE